MRGDKRKQSFYASSQPSHKDRGDLVVPLIVWCILNSRSRGATYGAHVGDKPITVRGG